MSGPRLLGLSFGVVLALGGIAAESASAAPPKCRINGAGASYGTLQEAADAASPGATLRVRGTCFGDAIVSKDLTIVGQSRHGRGVGQAILNGGNHGLINSGRVLTVEEGATVTITRLTVTGGQTVMGAGILNRGTLMLAHVTVAGNAADCYIGCGGPGPIGGGILNEGALTLDHSIVAQNFGANDGGGIWNVGHVTLDHSTVSDNESGEGGGIWNDDAGTVPGTVTLNHSRVTGNTARDSGGGIGNTTGTIVLNYSTVSGNSASTGGGIRNLSILRIIGKHPGPKGTVTLNHSTVTSNTAQLKGGGVENQEGPLTLNDSAISHNTAEEGGGLSNRNEGSVTLNGSSSITRNMASIDGGGIYNEPSTGATLTFGVEWRGRVSGNQPDDIFTG